ncbi:hypothetical protein [Anaerovibrio sp. RM50]|uniref:hypothetical protein n=1 Tax=Anaerovibrio sp. RM50 TaxID=1200557 RepID=UPI00048898E1|nr:hypothetical protein [Anaerovibrio sp. RM50]
MGINYDIFSADASNQARKANNNANMAAQAASANLSANVALLQMGIDITDALREMKNFQHQRFNDMIHTMRELNVEIQDLKAQVAGIQKRLYEQEQRSKEADENSSALEEMEPPCPEEIEP